MVSKGRCERCWHNRRDGHCICERLRRDLPSFDLDVRFVLYTHFKEFYCAGNTSKMLAAAAPDDAAIFVHGRRGDDAALVEVLRAPCAERRCLLLFPSDRAVAVDAFFDDARTPRVPARALGGAAPFYLVVVDATWPLARKMARHLDRLLDGGLPHAKLETDLVSVYARTQSKTGRVCTVPARRPTVAATGEVPFRAGRGHRPLPPRSRRVGRRLRVARRPRGDEQPGPQARVRQEAGGPLGLRTHYGQPRLVLRHARRRGPSRPPGKMTAPLVLLTRPF